MSKQLKSMDNGQLKIGNACLPKGWEIKKLGEGCTVFTDGNWIESKDQSTEGIRLVQTGNIGFGFYKNKVDKARYISEETFKRLKCTEILPGDLLVSRLPDPVGKSCIIPDINSKMITGVDCTIIRTRDYLLPVFLCYYQMSDKYLKDVQIRVTGTTRSRISRKNLGIIPIPIPPPPEQKRIVAILDKAFTAIDKAKSNAEKNLANAKELFESYLNGIFANPGEDWEEKELKEIGVIQTGTTPPTKDKSNYGDYISFVKPAHFKTDGSITTEDSMLSETGLNKGRLFEANSVLMVCIGATIGKTGFSEIPVSANQQINALTPSTKYVPKFLYYALISPFVQKQVMIQGKSAQATLPIINKSKWGKLRVNLSKDKKIQTKIVRTLENLKVETKHLEKIYQKKIADVEELKKSILQKAFEGEL